MPAHVSGNPPWLPFPSTKSAVLGYSAMENIEDAIDGLRVTVSASADSGWRIVGATGQPAFQNGFANRTAGYANAGFRIDALGYVHLQGVPSVASGTSTAVVFTLPTGYRTAYRKSFGTWAYDGTSQAAGRVDVLATGDVQITGTASQYAILDNITFLAEG